MQLLGAGGRPRTQACLYQRCDFLHSATHGSRWSLKTNQDYGDSLARDSRGLVPGQFFSHYKDSPLSPGALSKTELPGEMGGNQMLS